MAIKRHGGVRAVGQSVEKLTKPIFGRRGFAGAGVVTDWKAIVGEHLARHTQPDRISHDGPKRIDGTLHLRVDSASLATELVYLEPQLIERINTFFGYKAVARLRLVNGPIGRAEEKPKQSRRALTGDEKSNLSKQLSVVDDPDLKAALEALGSVILTDKG